MYGENGNVIPTDDGEPYGLLVLAKHFTTGDNWSAHVAVLGSLGVVTGVNERAVAGFVYSCRMRYLHDPLGGGIEFGIGYRS